MPCLKAAIDRIGLVKFVEGRREGVRTGVANSLHSAVAKAVLFLLEPVALAESKRVSPI
jgi:hypothetical protein